MNLSIYLIHRERERERKKESIQADRQAKEMYYVCE